uniref:Innexin n=1 Tax=Onchocerca volvulus TaxID=6282 RepID=A0A8R1TX68_ONCVO
MSIERLLKSLKVISLNYGEDNIDRLHYFLTSNLLIAASTITAWKMYEGRPLECMAPMGFTNSWAVKDEGKDSETAFNNRFIRSIA